MSQQAHFEKQIKEVMSFRDQPNNIFEDFLYSAFCNIAEAQKKACLLAIDDSNFNLCTAMNLDELIVDIAKAEIRGE